MRKWIKASSSQNEYAQGKNCKELIDELSRMGLKLDAADKHSICESRDFNDEKVTLFDEDGNTYEGLYNCYNDSSREIIYIKKVDVEGSSDVKKSVKASTDNEAMWKAFQKLVYDDVIEPEDVGFAMRVDWNDITPEDAAKFLRGIIEQGGDVTGLKSVDYYDDDVLMDRLGYDGGYTVEWKSGVTENYGFYADSSDLYPLVDVRTSQCSFDFDLGDDYDDHYLDIAINNIFEAMDMEVLGTDYRAVEYPNGKLYSQCSVDFSYKDYYNEPEIEEDLAKMIEEEGGNFFGIDFYSLED